MECVGRYVYPEWGVVGRGGLGCPHLVLMAPVHTLGMGKGLLEGSLLTFGPCGVPKSGHLVPPGPAPGAAASPRSLVLETGSGRRCASMERVGLR